MNDILWRLEAIVRDRKNTPVEGSYTSSLFTQGTPRIAQKVGEEATEVIVAALSQQRERQIAELADLLYHLLVLMTQMDVSLTEVMNELERRHH